MHFLEENDDIPVNKDFDRCREISLYLPYTILPRL